MEAMQTVYLLVLDEREGAYVSGEVQSEAAELVFDCLDTSDLAPSVRMSAAAEAAICLKETLDRIPLPEMSEIPGPEQLEEAAEEGRVIEAWTIPRTEITIRRVSEGPLQGRYLFSPRTVDSASDYYARVQHLPYRDPNTASVDFYKWYLSNAGWMIPDGWIRQLPEWTRRRFGGQVVWKWIGLFFTALFTIVAMVSAYFLGRRWTIHYGKVHLVRYLITWLFPIVAMLVPLMAQSFIMHQLHISGTPLAIANTTLYVVFLLSLFAVVMGAGNRVAEILIASPKIHPKGIDAQLIRLLSKVISLAAATAIVLEGGRYLGVPLTTLMAGAGVGGLAFALAAQDTLKGVLGSVMIVLDKPYRVGERIITKNYDGIVEEIGLRSTRIRLLSGHQVTIPNEELARSDIENVGRRPHIRRVTNLRIPLDTPPEKVERAVELIRSILDQHEGMPEANPPRVYLNEFNNDSFNIRMIYWYEPADYWMFLEFSQRVNLRIMNAFKAEDIEFALPSSKFVMSSEEGDDIASP